MADITIYYRDKIDNEKVLLDTKAEMLVYARDKNASEIIQAGLSFKNFIEHVTCSFTTSLEQKYNPL